MTQSEPTQRVVVVAEDEPHIRRILTLRLERRGYEVVEAANGIAALEALRELAGRDVVAIVDLMMPRMDGITLLKTMRGTESLKAIPALVISAVRDDKTRAELVEIGVQAILAKPFSHDELAEALEAAFGARSPDAP